MLNYSIKGHRYVGLRGKLSRRRVNTQNAHSYNYWLSDKGEIHSYVQMQQGFMLAAIWQMQEQFQTKLDGKFIELKHEIRAAEAKNAELVASLTAVQ
ncbi:hypothetical protein BGX38DRAFT_1270006 [Terfezia claveryi]|nr:hypothetical protein BGX38DRAFT_1270006 [Terfezia claveryi]